MTEEPDRGPALGWAEWVGGGAILAMGVGAAALIAAAGDPLPARRSSMIGVLPPLESPMPPADAPAERSADDTTPVPAEEAVEDVVAVGPAAETEPEPDAVAVETIEDAAEVDSIPPPERVAAREVVDPPVARAAPSRPRLSTDARCIRAVRAAALDVMEGEVLARLMRACGGEVSR